MKKVSDIVAEIAAASREQSAGIEQVNRAVMQMDELTQQNAALVEQATAASQAMADQARELNEMMARYRVRRMAADGRARAASAARTDGHGRLGAARRRARRGRARRLSALPPRPRPKAARRATPPVTMASAAPVPRRACRRKPGKRFGLAGILSSRGAEQHVPRILTVDDSVAMRQMVSATLTSAGYEVVQAAQRTRSAADRQRSKPVDLVITDVNMPQMDGIDAGARAAWRCARYRSKPLLFLTTESAAARKLEGREAGATGWMMKPFNSERLLATVARFLK